jgi:hypothetical protein
MARKKRGVMGQGDLAAGARSPLEAWARSLEIVQAAHALAKHRLLAEQSAKTEAKLLADEHRAKAVYETARERARRKRDLAVAERLRRKHGDDLTLGELVRCLSDEQPKRSAGRPTKWHAWHQRLAYLLVEELKKKHGISTRQAWRRAARLTGSTLEQIERHYPRGRELLQLPESGLSRNQTVAIAECLAEFSKA